MSRKGVSCESASPSDAAPFLRGLLCFINGATFVIIGFDLAGSCTVFAMEIMRKCRFFPYSSTKNRSAVHEESHIVVSYK